MPPRFRTSLLAACLLALACLAPSTAFAGSGGVSPSDARYQPAKKAKIVDGMAIVPNRPGAGLEWDVSSIKRYRMD